MSVAVVPFSISWTEEACKYPDEPARLSGAELSPLKAAMWRFVFARAGCFVLHFGSHDLTLELRPDFTTVFEHLPVLLVQITRSAPEPLWLDFFEQGTELLLEIRCEGPLVRVSFIPRRTSGFRSEDLPPNGTNVTARAFVVEWCRLARWFIRRLRQREPGIVASPEYANYLRALDTAEALVSGGIHA